MDSFRLGIHFLLSFSAIEPFLAMGVKGVGGKVICPYLPLPNSRGILEYSVSKMLKPWLSLRVKF